MGRKRSSLPETVTHIAAPWVNVGGRIIQRCLLCGAKLVDSLTAQAPLNQKTMTQAPMATWPVMGLVRVYPDKQILIKEDGGEGAPLPKDSCFPLIEGDL